MENNTEVIKVNNQHSQSLPPIGKLFSDSFNTFKASIKQIIILFLSAFGIGLLATLVLLVIVGISVFLKMYFLMLLLIPLFILLIGIGIAVQIGMILINDKPNALSIKEIYKKSARFILPFLAVSIVAAFLTVPAYFLFIIPGIIVSILLTFANYELVIGERGILDSFRRSAYVVKANFFDIFLRLLILFLMGIGLVIIESALARLTFFGIIGGVILRIALMWFSISFMVTLYKQAEALVPDKEKKSKLLGFVMLALAGLVVVVLFIFMVVKFINSNPEIKNTLMDEIMKTQNSNLAPGDATQYEDLYKEAYRSSFITSCANQGQDEGVCTCIADSLLDNYTTQELGDIMSKYAETKVIPAELTEAARTCSGE